jgi:hypothetical protein
MHKSATKCNETLGKWCKNKHGASKIIDTLETYQVPNWAIIYTPSTERGRPRYHIGKFTVVARKGCKISWRLIPSYLFGATWLLTHFVTRPVASPNLCNVEARKVTSFLIGLTKMAAVVGVKGSSYRWCSPVNSMKVSLIGCLA